MMALGSAGRVLAVCSSLAGLGGAAVHGVGQGSAGASSPMTAVVNGSVLPMNRERGRAEQVQVPSSDSVLVLDGVTVVDVTDGWLLPARTVVIVGNRVQALGPAGTVALPAGARRVDARGKYLLPGFWDMHAHVGDRSVNAYYPRFIANGVTGLREMGQRFEGGADSFRVWQRDIAAGRRVGPRVVGPSVDLTLPSVSSSSPMNKDSIYRLKGYFPIHTPAAAPAALDTLKAAGMAFLKYHDTKGEPEQFFAILRAARQAGMPVVGHIPRKVTSVQASDSGVRSVEHLAENHQCWPGWPRLADSVTVERQCAPVMAAYQRNDTWIVPTLVSHYAIYLGNSQFSAFLKYDIDDALRVMRTIRRLGFKHFLTGSDVDASGIRPGVSVRAELLLLVEAGLTPLEALQAATLNPAKFFRATDSLGTVAPGKLADLVLLAGNPLADIRNVLKLEAVVANGRYFDRVALDSLADPKDRDRVTALAARARFPRLGVLGIDSTEDAPGAGVGRAGEADKPAPSGGAFVRAIAPQSAAAAAGIQPGDVIVALDGKPVTSATQFAGRIRFMMEGTPVQLELLRAGARRTVRVTLRTP